MGAASEIVVTLPTLYPAQVAAYTLFRQSKRTAVRCGRRWGKCLPSGVRITLADGCVRPVEGIKPGDRVLTLNETTWRLEAKPILARLDNGIRPVREIRTAGRTLATTPNHPVLTGNGWTPVADLAVGDLIAVPRRTWAEVDEERPAGEVDFLAIWLAEGKAYTVCNTTPAVLDALRDAIRPWGLHLCGKTNSLGVDGIEWGITDGLGGRGTTPHHLQNKAARLLKDLGLWGKNSKSKFIPDFIYRLPQRQLARFLNLFIACDGSISRRCRNTWSLEIGLANEALVRQFAELLLRFGIRGQIRKKVHLACGRDGKPFVHWDYVVSEAKAIEVFATQIGALGKERQVAEALQGARASLGTCNQYLPITYRDVDQHLVDKRSRELMDRLRSWRKQSQERCSVRCYEKVRPWLDDAFAHLAERDVVWEEVKAVADRDAVQTWDLSVEDNHNFIAEGVITHNTDLAKVIACDAILKGQSIGWFAPTYKIMSEAYNEIAGTLLPVRSSSSKVEGVIRTTTGGRVDFWTLENDRAGRSRRYHGVIIDEAAFGKPNLTAVWEQAIKPTLLDYGGWALALSNTNGVDPDNFFYRICNEKEQYGFLEYHGPTHQNPYLMKEELDKLIVENHPLVYRQEYLAEFVDFKGDAFFLEEWLLADGKPVDYPPLCDAVFAVIDTAVKTGSANDGTAVSYWSTSKYIGHPLVCLDWDYVQIEGALLEVWIPQVFKRLETLAGDCRARAGSLGAFIEDAQSGSILLQQCRNRGLRAQALPQDLTSAGKDTRAINASAPVYQNKVKWSAHAFNKVLSFKGSSRNHMLAQVYGFRVGDKAAATRADDLLDTFTYAVAITLGDRVGIA